MKENDPSPEEKSSEDPKPTSLFARKIPMKWILGVILLYMLLHNLILFLNAQ